MPIGIGVSCSADRQALGKITKDGVFLEQLETEPSRFLPDYDYNDESNEDVVEIDLNVGMKKVLEELSKHPIRTRLSLNGPLIVARDLAHSRLRERLNEGEGLPDYFKEFPVYYAGPAKTPKVTHLDHSVQQLREEWILSLVSSRQRRFYGNVSKRVIDQKWSFNHKKHGGFYLGALVEPQLIWLKLALKVFR